MYYFSKAAITSDEKVQQKSGKLFGKRLLYAVLVFTIPWLVEVLMVTLGNLIGKDGQVNFTDCIENANGERIEQLEQGIENDKKGLYCWQCNDNSSLLQWGTSAKDNANCHAGWHKLTNVLREDCGVKVCWQCNDNSSLYNWGISAGSNANCHAGWHQINRTEENCK